MQWLWLKTSIPVLSFVSEFQGGFVSLQVENAGAKTVWIQHLLGWAGQGHSTLGSKAGMERAWILHLLLPWALENPEESRGVCADSNARWVFVLCPREGRLCTASDAHSHTQSSLATAVTFSEREERFWLSPCKFGSKLSMLLLELCRPFPSSYPWTCSTFPKIVQSVNREFPELWSYPFCIIWFTIPLKVFILPLIKLKSACSLVQELTSLWCYILCNGVRAGKAFTAKPRGELNLQPSALAVWAPSCPPHLLVLLKPVQVLGNTSW